MQGQMSLATLRYERAAPKTNESKQGVPIFDGTPAGFYEWEFRAMTRYQATEDTERWKLASRLCEGLTGESLKVAMSLGVDKLAQNDGVLKLVEALKLHIFPMASAEARELFKAGQRPGVLSRQVGEPFISYISRRRRWYDLLKKLDHKLEIPSTLRGELLLDHANLSQAEKLMVMTSTFNNLEFDVVAEALVKQHAIAHSLKSPDTQHRKGKGKGWARSYYGAEEDWSGWYEFTDQLEEPEAYFANEDEGWQDWQGDELYAWYAGSETPWDMTWEPAEAPWYPETAWYGEDSSWNEGMSLDPYEEMIGDFLSESKDADQIAMEIQTAYLAGVDNGEMNIAYKGKGKSSSKGKGFGKSKGKTYSKGYGGKGYGKKGLRGKPGELSLEDRRKRLEELKKKTKCQDCGQIGHWAGDSVCPKRKGTAHMAVCAGDDSGMTLVDPGYARPQSMMAVKRTTTKKTPSREKSNRARSSDKAVEVSDDQVVEVTDSDHSPEPRMRAIVARASSEDWTEVSPPPSPDLESWRRDMLRKLRNVPMKDTRMTTGKNRGSTYEMIVLSDSEYCMKLMQTQRKIKDEISMKDWLQCLFKINGGILELKPKESWEDPTKSKQVVPDQENPGCPGGCKTFSRRGTNAYYDVQTCKECGKQTRTKKEIMEEFSPEECPHDVLDHRGSSKAISRTFCLQCKTFINEVSQEEKKERKYVAAELEAKGSDDAISAVQSLLTQEEKLLTKEEALACIEHLTGYVDGIKTKIKPSELLKAMTDSIDVIHERVRRPNVAMVAAYSRAMAAMMPIIPGPSKLLREVDIMEPSGSIWATLDEGCNTTCHSKAWRLDAERKFIEQGFVVERYDSKKEYHGVGDKPVETKHCYMFPFNISLGPEQRSLAGVLSSQELGHEGFVPLLLSLPNQCTMGLVKDMRNGTCYLSDYGVSIELCVAKQNGLLCIDIGNMAKVLERRSKLPTNLRHLRWGSEEWMEAFTGTGRHCNAMPDAPEPPIQLDELVNYKDRGSWADWTEDMDKTSEVSSIHSEPGLTNRFYNNHGNHESSCHTNMSHDVHLTAAISDPNSSEGENPGVVNQEISYMAESRKDKQILIVSLGVKSQEDTSLWQDRTPGGLKKEQLWLKNNDTRYGNAGLARAGDGMLGDGIAWAVNWHHNGDQKKVQHALFTGDAKMVIIDARERDDDQQRHACSYPVHEAVQANKGPMLNNSLRMAGKQLKEHLESKEKNPIVICVADHHGRSVAPFVAQTIYKTLKEQFETKRPINIKHLGEQNMPKKCSFEKICRICRVGDDSHETERTARIFNRSKSAAEENIATQILLAFRDPDFQKKAAEKKIQESTERALKAVGSREAHPEDKKGRKKDEPAKASKRERSRGRSREKKTRKTDSKEDLERYELEDLVQMQMRISEQINKRKALSKAREDPPKGKEKTGKHPKEEKVEKDADEAPDYSPSDEDDKEPPKVEEPGDESSEPETVSERTKQKIREDLTSDSDDRDHRPGGLSLKPRSRSPRRSERPPSPEHPPSWKGDYKGDWNKGWHGGKGKYGKNKDKSRGKSTGYGHWEWRPDVQVTADEVTRILMDAAKEAEIGVRVKMSWLEVKELKASVRICSKPAPRHTRISIMPECRSYRKWSYVQNEDGSWQCIEANEPTDNETGFEEDEKPRCCQVFLVPPGILKEPGEPSTAMYASMGRTSADQQTLLLEGHAYSALQRGAYMGRVSEAVKSLKHLDKTGPNRPKVGTSIGKLLIVLLGQFSLSSAHCLSQSPGSTFFHIKSDKHFGNLESKLRRDENNLLVVAGRNCKEHWINDIAQISDATSNHSCFITPQFGHNPSMLDVLDMTRWNGPGDITIWSRDSHLFEPLYQWAGQKDKFHAPRSHDDVVRDPDIVARLEKISENICNEDVYDVAFPAEASEIKLEDLGTLDQPDEPEEAGDEELPATLKEVEEAFDQEEEMLESLPLPNLPKDEKSRREQWLRMPRAARIAVRKLHRQFGHCPNRVLVEILRASGAKADLIQAARLMRCQGCEHERPKPQTAKVALPRTSQFNESVGIDIFEVKDKSGTRYSILSFICLGTTYHQAAIIQEGTTGQPSSRKCLEIFLEKWIQIFGTPTEVVSDRGLHNRGAFAKGLSSRGVILRNIGVESPEQLGRVERHGGILKGMMQRIIHELGLTGELQVKEALSESLHTKNSQSRIKGFTPTQWVFGKLPKEPGMATDEKMDLGVLEALADERHEFAQVMEIRETARKAFVREDLSRRVAKAILRKAAPVSKEYGVGDLVCFKTDQSGWSTASRVIGFEGPKVVWLIHQGTPICAALDRLRPVNAAEALAYQHLKDEKGLGAIQGRKVGFVDISETIEPIEDGEDEYIPTSPMETPEEEDEGAMQAEENVREGRQRNQSLATTTEEPDIEVIPGSRRRSREHEALLDDVPHSVRRRISDSVLTESRAPAIMERASSQPSESRASPLAESMERAGTTGAGLEIMAEGWNRSNYTTAKDEWQYIPEVGLLVRKHESPRTALFSPDMTEDCPIPKEELSETRITEMAFCDGGNKRRHDTWDEGSCVNMDGEWTGKTIFILKSTVQERQKENHEVHAFLAERSFADTSKSGKKKATGKQFNYELETEETRKGIDGSRRDEWEKWQKFMAVKPIEGNELKQLLDEGHKPISTQWIDTDKNLHLKRPGQPHTVKYKSRLVARGDQEKTLGIRTDSPTADLDSVNMILSWASSEKLRLMSLDITNAYFHGETMTRLMILRPPRGGIPTDDFHPDRMYICRTPIYGSRDSGRLFWKRLKKESVSAGLTASKLSSALFYVAQDGEPKVMMASHVDDLIYACKPGFEHIMKRVQKIFQVEDAKVSTGSFRFCGREIVQDEDYSIKATCKDTTEKLEKIKYRTQVKKETLANDGEKAQLRSVVGSLAWIARQARPDLSYKVSKLQSRCNRATMKDLVYANQAVDEAKEHSNNGITFKSDAIDWKTCIIVTVSDASWSNEEELSKKELKKYKSQRARMTILANPDFLEKKGSAFHVLSWQSTIIRRVCRNTLQAETYGVSFAIEEGIRVRGVLAEVHGKLPSLRNWEESTRSFKQHIWITDCKSLEEHLKSDTMNKVDDKRLSIDIQALRQLIWENAEGEEQDELTCQLPDIIQWVDTSKMLVDALTKDMNGNELRATLKEGHWSTIPTEEAQITKMKKQKYRREKAEERRQAAEEEELSAGEEFA